MIKNISIWCILIGLSCNSCKSQQNNNDDLKSKQPVLFDQGVNDLTLINLSKDSTEIHIEFGMPSGDYSAFDFKAITKNKTDTNPRFRALFIELKRSENKNIPIKDPHSLQPLNYHAYAFEISPKDWNDLRTKIKKIVSDADMTLLNNFCQLCPSYSIVYDNKLIEDKLTKDKKIETLFNELSKKYGAWLYASKK